MTENDHAQAGSRMVEWIVAAVSAVFVGAVMFHLAWQAVSAGDGPPDFVAVVEAVDAAGDGAMVVRVMLHNRGDVAVADVVLLASAPLSSGAVETRQLVFDAVPARSVRRGAIVLPVAPVESVSLRVAGYQEM